MDRFDTILAHGLCFPDMEHGLDDLALDYSEELPWKSRKRWSLELYCAKDVRVTWDSYRALQGELDELGLTKLMEKQLRRAQVLHEMCNHGVRVNHGRMHQVRVQLEQRQLHLTHQLSKASGMITGRVRRARCLERAADSLLATAAANWVPGKKREFGKLKTRAKHLRREAYDLVNVNWRSHDQKVDLLYRWLEAPQQWKTDHRGRRSLTCDKDAVVEIRRRASDDKLKVPYLGALRQITEVLNAWNEYATVVGTFTSYTDRVLKPDLRLFGTATGRLACRNPNLQNLPKRKDYSWMIRSMFEPVTPGNVFIGRDYSQIEARLQAHMSQEPSMVEAFERGEDIHSKTAALCLTQARGRTVLPGEVTPQERLVHKRAVYLESYGGGWLRLQRALAAEGVFISTLQAKDTLRSLRAARPVLAAYREELLDRAAQRRMLRTEFGRLRWFLGPAYGEVLNFPFQSNTAEIILDAMVRIRQRLPEGAKLVLQVHDELFVECPPGVVEEVDQMMKEVMESPIPELGGWTCPTDAKTGPNLAFKEY